MYIVFDGLLSGTALSAAHNIWMLSICMQTESLVCINIIYARSMPVSGFTVALFRPYNIIIAGIGFTTAPSGPFIARAVSMHMRRSYYTGNSNSGKPFAVLSFGPLRQPRHFLNLSILRGGRNHPTYSCCHIESSRPVYFGCLLYTPSSDTDSRWPRR